MAILQHCWYCSLNVAASVLAVYTAVAYLIAFFIEIWLVWEAEGFVPYVEYVLAFGFFLTFILAVILIRGISERRLNHLVVWMSGMLAMLLPEAGLVIFMATNVWKIHSVNGLTELTFWACRLIFNVCAIICVQSLYSNWKEENEVISSLKDLNKVSTKQAKNRRDSVSSDQVNILTSYMNQGYSSIVEYEKTPPVIRRSESMLSVNSRVSITHTPEVRSEFDATRFIRDWRTGSVNSGSIVGVPPTRMGGSVIGMPPSRMGGSVIGMPPSRMGGSVIGMPPSRMGGSVIGMPPSRMGGNIIGMPPSRMGGSVIGMPTYRNMRMTSPMLRSRSLGDLRGGQGFGDPSIVHPNIHGSLDRPRRSSSMSVRSAYFGSLLPPPGFLLDPCGQLVRDPRYFIHPPPPPHNTSKLSLPESEDYNYKDVAL